MSYGAQLRAQTFQNGQNQRQALEHVGVRLWTCPAVRSELSVETKCACGFSLVNPTSHTYGEAASSRGLIRRVQNR